VVFSRKDHSGGHKQTEHDYGINHADDDSPLAHGTSFPYHATNYPPANGLSRFFYQRNASARNANWRMSQ
jgi:hypothetical protein